MMLSYNQIKCSKSIKARIEGKKSFRAKGNRGTSEVICPQVWTNHPRGRLLLDHDIGVSPLTPM